MSEDLQQDGESTCSGLGERDVIAQDRFVWRILMKANVQQYCRCHSAKMMMIMRMKI